MMSAGCLFWVPLRGSEEAAPAKRTTQVVTAPIAAITAPAGTVISIVVDRGLTPGSPPGAVFEGHTLEAFKVRDFTIAPVGMPVRGIVRGISESREDFPEGAPDLAPVLTGILIRDKWESVSAVLTREQDSVKPQETDRPGEPDIGRLDNSTTEADSTEKIVLSGPALQLPVGARLTFHLAKPFFTILTLEPSAAP